MSAKSVAQHLEQNGYVELNGQRVWVGENPPPDPKEGDVWFKPSEKRYYGYR